MDIFLFYTKSHKKAAAGRFPRQRRPLLAANGLLLFISVTVIQADPVSNGPCCTLQISPIV